MTAFKAHAPWRGRELNRRRIDEGPSRSSDLVLTPFRCAALALFLLAGLPAFAQAPAAPATAEATAKAKELFSAAQKLYKAGRFAEAIVRFEEARAAKPHPIIYFNIARCHEQLGETGKALRAYRDYLRLSPGATDRDTVKESMAVLERRLKDTGVQQVLIFAEPESARVSIDGKEVGLAPASAELIAGAHKLVVTAEGFEPLERSFTVELTRFSEQTVSLQPLKSKPVAAVDAPTQTAVEPTVVSNGTASVDAAVKKIDLVPAPKKQRVFTWVAAGTAVAAAGVGVGLGVASANASASLRNASAPLDGQTAQRLANDSVSLSTGANVTYALAGAALVTAVVLFFVEAP